MENAYTYLAQYSRQARRAGVSKAKIDSVIEDATNGDYDHLVGVIFSALSDLEAKET